MILTATRTTEVIHAQFHEFDLAKRVWFISANRMKEGIDHKIPLSDEALAIVKKLRRWHNHTFVFVRDGFEKPISNNAMLYLIRRDFPKLKSTVHGLRTSFREWA